MWEKRELDLSGERGNMVFVEMARVREEFIEGEGGGEWSNAEERR